MTHPTATPVSRKLERLTRQTQLMLKHAQRSEWEQVDYLQISRANEMQQGLAQELQNTDPEVARQTLATLLSMNNQLMEQVTVARQSAMQDNQRVQKSRTAASGYSEINLC